jgi:O-acetyl-ADP-ribose deacetylase (regulator of RNase III)
MIYYSTINIVEFAVTIVNAANDKLIAGGGVCGAIFKEAGPFLKKECDAKIKRRKKRLATGSAVCTYSYDCNATQIIHAVGPIYYNYDHATACELLSKTYVNALECPMHYPLDEIVFPAISCGIYGFPIPDACKIAVHTLNYCLLQRRHCNVTVILTAFDPLVKAEYIKLGLPELP